MATDEFVPLEIVLDMFLATRPSMPVASPRARSRQRCRFPSDGRARSTSLHLSWPPPSLPACLSALHVLTTTGSSTEKQWNWRRRQCRLGRGQQSDGGQTERGPQESSRSGSFSHEDCPVSEIRIFWAPRTPESSATAVPDNADGSHTSKGTQYYAAPCAYPSAAGSGNEHAHGAQHGSGELVRHDAEHVRGGNCVVPSGHRSCRDGLLHDVVRMVAQHQTLGSQLRGLGKYMVC